MKNLHPGSQDARLWLLVLPTTSCMTLGQIQTTELEPSKSFPPQDKGIIRSKRKGENREMYGKRRWKEAGLPSLPAHPLECQPNCYGVHTTPLLNSAWVVSFIWWLFMAIFFHEISVQIFCPFLLVVFSLRSCKRHLYILDISILSDISAVYIFFYSKVWLFIFSTISFKEQKFLILITLNLSFLKYFCAFCILSMNFYLPQSHKDFLLCCLLNTLEFGVLHLVPFRIHLHLLSISRWFLCMAQGKISCSLFSCTDIWLIQHYLLKRLFSLH